MYYTADLQKLTRPRRLAHGCASIYSDNSPPVIQSEMSWKGDMVVPKSETMFGWSKRFHTMTSLQKAYESHQVGGGDEIHPTTHRLIPPLVLVEVRSKSFYRKFSITQIPFVDITGTPRGNRPPGSYGRVSRRTRLRYNLSRTAYRSEFSQAFPKHRIGGGDGVKCLSKVG